MEIHTVISDTKEILIIGQQQWLDQVVQGRDDWRELKD